MAKIRAENLGESGNVKVYGTVERRENSCVVPLRPQQELEKALCRDHAAIPPATLDGDIWLIGGCAVRPSYETGKDRGENLPPFDERVYGVHLEVYGHTLQQTERVFKNVATSLIGKKLCLELIGDALEGGT